MASSIEGMAQLIVPNKPLKRHVDPAALTSLKAYISAWTGHKGLKEAALGRIGSLARVTSSGVLRDLAAQGVGTKEQIESWSKFRNRAMHGEMLSRYSSKEDDQILVDMADLLRALTREASRLALIVVEA